MYRLHTNTSRATESFTTTTTTACIIITIMSAHANVSRATIAAALAPITAANGIPALSTAIRAAVFASFPEAAAAAETLMVEIPDAVNRAPTVAAVPYYVITAVLTRASSISIDALNAAIMDAVAAVSAAEPGVGSSAGAGALAGQVARVAAAAPRAESNGEPETISEYGTAYDPELDRPSSPTSSASSESLLASETIEATAVGAEADPELSPFAALSEMHFASSAELRGHMDVAARSEGFCVRTKSSRPGKYVVYVCRRSGAYINRLHLAPEERLRRGNSCRTGCPFRVRGSCRDGRWSLRLVDLHHNHEQELFANPQARRFSDTERTMIRTLRAECIESMRILSALTARNVQLGVNVAHNLKDVHNAIQAMDRAELDGQNIAEYFLAELEGCGLWQSTHLLDSDRRLKRVLMVSRSARELLPQSGCVLTLDCTYKTNRYSLPTLHVVSSAPNNMTFTVAVCLMEAETEVQYSWAVAKLFELLPAFVRPPVLVTDRDRAFINAIKETAPDCPHILCAWHILKAVKGRVKREILGVGAEEDVEGVLEAWQAVMDAKTPALYRGKRGQLLGPATQAYPGLRRYFEQEWLVHHELFVRAWTSQHLHRGHRTSSRVEGAHAAIKRWNVNSTTNLRGLLNGLNRHLQSRLRAVTAALRCERTRDPVDLPNAIFGECYQVVSRYALEKVNRERIKLRRDRSLPPNLQSPHRLQPCTQSLRRSDGVPCAHELRQLLEQGLPLTAAHFHEAWHLMPAARVRVREPAVTQPTRAVTTASHTSDRRVRSHFEVQEAQAEAALAARRAAADIVAARASSEIAAGASTAATGAAARGSAATRVYRCALCHEQGHNRRRCPQSRTRAAAVTPVEVAATAAPATQAAVPQSDPPVSPYRESSNEESLPDVDLLVARRQAAAWASSTAGPDTPQAERPAKRLRTA